MAVLMGERIVSRAPTLFGDEIEQDRQRRDDGVGGGPTLDETIVGAWEGLTAQVAVACPLCAEGTLRPVGSAGAWGGEAGAGGPDEALGRGGDPAGGRCDHCGAQLA
jgi:hypothetical protein